MRQLFMRSSLHRGVKTFQGKWIYHRQKRVTGKLLFTSSFSFQSKHKSPLLQCEHLTKNIPHALLSSRIWQEIHIHLHIPRRAWYKYTSNDNRMHNQIFIYPFVLRNHHTWIKFSSFVYLELQKLLLTSE